MCSNREKLTPEAESSPDGSPIPASTKFSKLRIKSKSPPSPEPHVQRSTGSLKRPAADELLDRDRKGSESPGRDTLHLNNNQHSPSYPNYPPNHKYQKHGSCKDRGSQKSCSEMKHYLDSRRHSPKVTIADRHDSGIVMEVNQHLPHMQDATLIINQSHHSIGSYRESIGNADSQLIRQHSLHLRGKNKWAIELQPEFSPISQEQLAAEVKGIYAGLVMVEAKCINIDSQKASHPEELLSTEQWQALVALHRTLLYEHHDFLMATQHPSANPALLGLATKYSMPARMWKHGIHAFLEVLRHRRPDSQEYMLAFIYLAYQMMSLLLETVPGFTDTWIECLGDLARYRMAIEEDREIHTIWGGVAGRWYAMAADRHPTVGRLYHHSGILERPSLRKFYLFARALTSAVPFLNAKESLGTLCAPLLNDGVRTGNQSAETFLICFHARAFTWKEETQQLQRDCTSALTQLTDQSEQKFACYGVPLAVTNIAAVFGYGSPNNLLRQLFDTALNKDVLASRPSRDHPSASASTFQLISDPALFDLETPLPSAIDFCHHSFNTIIRRAPGKDSLQCLLPFVHIMLVFFSSIETLHTRLGRASSATTVTTSTTATNNSPRNKTYSRHTLDSLFSGKLDWSALSHFLNHTASHFPITAHIEAFADTGTFPSDGLPLLEDYMMRGLVWAQWYHSALWFQRSEDDDGSRALEADGDEGGSRSKKHLRAARVLYLGMKLARQSRFLNYDHTSRRFSAVAVADEVVPADTAAVAASDIDEMASPATAATEDVRSTTSTHSSGDSSGESDGYVVVPRSTPTPSSRSSVYVSGSAGCPQDGGVRAALKDCPRERSSTSSSLKSKNKTRNRDVKPKEQRRADPGVEIVGDDSISWV